MVAWLLRGKKGKNSVIRIHISSHERGTKSIKKKTTKWMVLEEGEKTNLSKKEQQRESNLGWNSINW